MTESARSGLLDLERELSCSVSPTIPEVEPVM